MGKLSFCTPTAKKICGYANELKSKPTLAEQMLFSAFKKSKLKVSFQKYYYSNKIGSGYIVDFFLRTDGAKIVIEVDGGYHFSEYQMKKDEYRSDWLRKNRGCTIIRFSNEDIFNNVDACVSHIAKVYINLIKPARNRSKNYHIFCRILGVQEPCKIRRPLNKIENTDWGSKDPLF